ncbi:MAG: Clp1/GlmU family protein [Nitrososphaeria archaeon]|nr:Clp1/GlmU family protein [Nitrososphaeria archaeon]
MPRIELKKGDTLILYGPASALLVEGKASVLGCPLSSKRKLVIKSWRSRPIHAEDHSVIDCTYGEGGGLEVIEGDTVPEGWRKFAEKVSERPSRVCVYGAVDSGKTSLATLLLNALAKKFGSAIYLDLDAGQSNICPPSTIGYTSVRSPIPDVSYLRMEFGEVVGYTSPTPLAERHLRAAEILVKKIGENYRGVSISGDFDGWVSGEGAITHKAHLLSIVRPDFMASIGTLPEEVKSICEEHGIAYEELPPPSKVRKREQSSRKKLREIAYNRFLRKSILRKIPITWIKLETLNGEEDPKKISSHIRRLIEAFSEENDLILDLTGAGGINEVAKKGVGILSYIYDSNGAFAGIGLLVGFDLHNNSLRILTPFAQQIKRMIIGSILLSIEGEEVYANARLLAQGS